MASSVRGKGRIFYNLACSLDSVVPTHPKDEIPIMKDFLGKVLATKPEIVKFSAKDYDQESITGFYFTERACWFSRQVRFSDKEESLAYRHMQFEDLVCTISSAARLINFYKHKYSKPLGIFVGFRRSHSDGGQGHCVGLILFKEGCEWKAIVKESLPKEEAKMPSACLKLLQAVHIKHAKLICQLPNEEEIVNTHCIKEAYRTIGNVMDGFYPEYLQKFQFRIFDTFGKREIVVQPSRKAKKVKSPEPDVVPKLAFKLRSRTY